MPALTDIDMGAVKAKAREYLFTAKNKSIEIKRKIFRELHQLVKHLMRPVIDMCEKSCKTTRQAATSPTKVIGGSLTNALPQVGKFEVNQQTWCTGTLIAPDKVVTAAHCLIDVKPSEMNFVMEDDKGGATTTLAIRSFAAHPKHDRVTNNYDIGYVILAGKAPYSPMELASTLDELHIIGTKLLAVGDLMRRSLVSSPYWKETLSTLAFCPPPVSSAQNP